MWNDRERYIYDGSDIVAQYNTDTSGNFQLSHRYLHGPAVDQILADEQYLVTEDPGSITGNVLYPLVDNLGTVRDIISYDAIASTTEVVNHLTYSSYGVIVVQSNATIDFIYGWTSRELDKESTLQYNRHRYYEAATGMWINEDPIGFLSGDANLRRYVGNAATNATDPDGMMKKWLRDFLAGNSGGIGGNKRIGGSGRIAGSGDIVGAGGGGRGLSAMGSLLPNIGANGNGVKKSKKQKRVRQQFQSLYLKLKLH